MLSITTSTGHKLDLFPDTTISIEENSPMFTDIGSYSLPVELPPTPGNLEALDFPDRVQRRARFVKSTRVTLACGPYSRVCRMHIDSAVHRSTISATLYLRESNFYNAIKGVRLQELFEDKVRKDYQPASNTNANQWIPYLEKVMCGDVNDDFHIFPVILSIDDREDGEHPNTRTWKKFLIANRPAYFKSSGSGYSSLTNVSQSGVKYYMLAGTDYELDENGTLIDIAPPGYTVAPYLKLVYVLRYAFSELGYTLKESILDTDYSFTRLCILHPVVDAIVKHEIRYSQLLPDIDFITFIEMVEHSFGVRFVVDESFKTITPCFFKDVLIDDPIADYSSQIEDYPQIAYAESKALRLTAIHESEFSSPVDSETWQLLIKKYGAFRGSVSSAWQLASDITENKVQAGLYLLRYERRLAHVFRKTDNSNTWDWKQVDSYVHDFSPIDSEIILEDKDLNFAITPLHSVPIVGHTLRTKISDSSNSWIDFTDYIAKLLGASYHVASGEVASFPFIDKVQNLNTVLETVSVDSDNNTTVTYTEESDVQAPIYLAFAHGFENEHFPDPERPKTMFSSQDAFDNLGNIKGTFDLMPLSLYQNFWERYDQLLETSFHDFSARINLTLSQIMSLRFDKPVTVRGSTALPLSLTYSLSHKGVEVVDFTLRIITPYE